MYHQTRRYHSRPTRTAHNSLCAAVVARPDVCDDAGTGIPASPTPTGPHPPDLFWDSAAADLRSVLLKRSPDFWKPAPHPSFRNTPLHFQIARPGWVYYFSASPTAQWVVHRSIVRSVHPWLDLPPPRSRPCLVLAAPRHTVCSATPVSGFRNPRISGVTRKAGIAYAYSADKPFS